MNTPEEREHLLARLSDAFSRSDYAPIIEAMGPDVDVEVPGSSAFAGHHHGPEEVGRWLRGMRRAFVPSGKPIEFSHEGDDMVMTQVVRLKLGEWNHRIRLTFDESGRIARIVWEADDIETFDVLVEAVFGAADRPRDRRGSYVPGSLPLPGERDHSRSQPK
jgi:hypothetical protein